jgi:hypothetical protein
MSLFIPNGFQNFVSEIESLLGLNFLGSLEQDSIEFSN